jgi:hypothetical protein
MTVAALRSHPEVNHGDIASRGARHRTFFANNRYVIPFSKQIKIMLEITSEGYIPELIQILTGIARQPVFSDFLFCLHEIQFFAKIINLFKQNIFYLSFRAKRSVVET